MKEWHRTAILMIFLLVLIGLIVWSRQQVDTSLLTGL
jgi:hypothetical protein